MMTPKMRSPASDDDLRQVFNALDVDRNGIVTDDDVRALFRRLGHEKNVKENLATMISASEIGSTDGISFPGVDFLHFGTEQRT
jgi:Ca2+-binding EF-hand superfamily protein